jgi:hypothetical protein
MAGFGAPLFVLGLHKSTAPAPATAGYRGLAGFWSGGAGTDGVVVPPVVDDEVVPHGAKDGRGIFKPSGLEWRRKVKETPDQIRIEREIIHVKPVHKIPYEDLARSIQEPGRLLTAVEAEIRELLIQRIREDEDLLFLLMMSQ